MGGALPFPISINGSIRFEAPEIQPDGMRRATTRIERVVQEIEWRLKAAAVSAIFIEGIRIRFKAGFFRGVSMSNPWGSSRNFLDSIGSGSITLREEGNTFIVNYHLSMLEALAISTVLSALLGATLLDASNVDTLSAIMITCLVWLFFVGGPYLYAMIRFPLWLEIGLHHLGQQDDDEPVSAWSE
jgi:hypothetical protein